MRHAIPETLVQQFHAKISTFHLSCREYAVLPLYWMAILGLRIKGYPVSSDPVDFATTSELLGIRYPFTLARRQYFRPTEEPHMEWLRENVPWVVEPNEIALR